MTSSTSAPGRITLGPFRLMPGDPGLNREVWWIFSPRSEEWGGLRIAIFSKAQDGTEVCIIHAEFNPSRIGLRVWEDIRAREGWQKVKPIETPSLDEVRTAIGETGWATFVKSMGFRPTDSA